MGSANFIKEGVQIGYSEPKLSMSLPGKFVFMVAVMSGFVEDLIGKIKQAPVVRIFWIHREYVSPVARSAPARQATGENLG